MYSSEHFTKEHTRTAELETAAHAIRKHFGVVAAGESGTCLVAGKAVADSFRTGGSLPRLKSLSRP